MMLISRVKSTHSKWGRSTKIAIIFVLFLLPVIIFPGYKICGYEKSVSISRMEKRTTNYVFGIGFVTNSSPGLLQAPKESNVKDWKTLSRKSRFGLPNKYEFSSYTMQQVEADFANVIGMERGGGVTREQMERFVDLVSLGEIGDSMAYANALRKEYALKWKEGERGD